MPNNSTSLTSSSFFFLGVQLSESVLLTFSDVTLDKWQNEGKSSVLKSTLANLTTSYCRTHSVGCGLSAGNVRY